MSDQNQSRVAYIAEVTRGTTPASALTELRVTSAQFEDERSTQPDADLGTRRVRDQVRTMRQASGQIDTTLRYGELDTLLAGALANTWETDGITTGTDRIEDGTTKTYFTFEKDLADVGSSFVSWAGCSIDQLSVNIPRDEKVTVGFSVMGNAGASAAATAGSGSYTAAGTTPEMVGGDISAFQEGGSGLTKVAGLSFQVANSLIRESGLGSLDPDDFGLGRLDVTGTLRIYFQDFTAYNKFQALTSSSIRAEITDTAGNYYAFYFPEVRYTTGRVIASAGLNDSIFVELGFRAQEDTTETAVIVMERNPA